MTLPPTLLPGALVEAALCVTVRVLAGIVMTKGDPDAGVMVVTVAVGVERIPATVWVLTGIVTTYGDPVTGVTVTADTMVVRCATTVAVLAGTVTTKGEPDAGVIVVTVTPTSVLVVGAKGKLSVTVLAGMVTTKGEPVAGVTVTTVDAVDRCWVTVAVLAGRVITTGDPDAGVTVTTMPVGVEASNGLCVMVVAVPRLLGVAAGPVNAESVMRTGLPESDVAVRTVIVAPTEGVSVTVSVPDWPTGETAEP